MKDIIAHVAWYEREVARMLESRVMTSSGLWAVGADERNAAIYEESRGMSPEDARAESSRVFRELVEQLELLPDAGYADASRFSGMPGDWKPWELIAGNTFGHYPDHAGAIRRLLDAKG